MRVILPIRNKFTAKDQAKSDRANKFIGRGSARSSTNAYRIAWGDRANCGEYTSRDVVFISVEGARSTRLCFDKQEVLKAIEAEAQLITDTVQDRAREYNVGERELASFLRENGMIEVTPGAWKRLPF